jgi:membrane associated rhomboid family serine protease
VANPRATTIGLVALNAAVWLAIVTTGSVDGPLFRAFALLPETAAYRLNDGSVAVVEGVAGGAWWQVLTANFTHYSPIHIAMNMLFLFWVGPIIEAPLGRARFLAACVVTGLTSSAAVMWLSESRGQTMGFSGIAMGLFGMFVVLALKVGGNRDILVQMIGFQLVFNLFARDIVSWQGHLGGFVGGLLVGAILAYAPRRNRAVVQYAGIAAVALVALGLIALRATQLAAGSPFAQL